MTSDILLGPIIISLLFVITFGRKISCKLSVCLSGFSARLAECTDLHSMRKFSSHFMSESLNCYEHSKHCEKTLKCPKSIHFPQSCIVKALVSMPKMPKCGSCSRKFSSRGHLVHLTNLHLKKHMLHRRQENCCVQLATLITILYFALRVVGYYGVLCSNGKH